MLTYSNDKDDGGKSFKFFFALQNRWGSIRIANKHSMPGGLSNSTKIDQLEKRGDFVFETYLDDENGCPVGICVDGY